MTEFFKRRVRRILPPYWIFLLLTVVIISSAARMGWLAIYSEVAPFVDPQTLTIQQWLGNITLTELLRFHFMSDPFRMFMGHAWTLSYEEQFYAVCGILLMLAPRRLFAGVALVTLLTLCVAPLTFKKVG